MRKEEKNERETHIGKREEITTMTKDTYKIFLSFSSFILRKSFADDMIICLFSCIVTFGLLMSDRKTE